MKPTAVSEHHVLTPHGSKHKDDVRQIQEDHQRIDPPKHLPASFSDLRPRGPAGWIASAIFTPSEPLKSMSVTFKVPEPPLENGALIYLFPAAESAFLHTILQPVLQWGNNKAFGGDCWKLACWHCTPEGVTLYSSPIDVNAGEMIESKIEVVECHDDSCDWMIEAKVIDEPGRCTKMLVYDLKFLLLFLAAGALEVYVPDDLGSLPNWKQYPESGSTTFHNIKLESLSNNPFRADWNTRFLLNVCGLDVHVSNDKSSVTLNYP